MTDWEALRKLFPVTERCVYLDNGSLSPLALPVFEAANRFLEYRRDVGRDFASWWETADRVRGKLAKLLGADASEICFTDSTTRGVNLIARGLQWQKGDNIILCEGEFPSNLYPWLNLQRDGVELRFLPGTRMTADLLEKTADSRTRLAAVSQVQATDGYRCDLSAISRFCLEKGIRLLVDGTQSLGAVPLDVRELEGVDFLCAASYKWLLGPDGLGFVYVRKARQKELSFSDLGWSGRTDRNDFTTRELDYPQEARRFELGNLNYSALHGLEAALDLLDSIGVEEIFHRDQRLAARLKGLLQGVPGLKLNSPEAPEETGFLINFDVPGRGKVHRALAEQGFFTGLKANGIRACPNFFNTEEELERFVQALREAEAAL